MTYLDGQSATQAHDHLLPPQPERPREEAAAPREDPLALDPYGPTFPASRGPQWNDPDPLGLDPYSPIAPVRARRPG